MLLKNQNIISVFINQLTNQIMETTTTLSAAAADNGTQQNNHPVQQVIGFRHY